MTDEAVVDSKEELPKVAAQEESQEVADSSSSDHETVEELVEELQKNVRS